MNIQEAQKTENNVNLGHENQVNNFCQNLISNNLVNSVHVQQEGEYLNINIKIKIDPAQIQQNNIQIQNSDNRGQNLRQETPTTSTQHGDNSFRNSTIIPNTSLEHPVNQANNTISYESFKDKLVNKKKKQLGTQTHQVMKNAGLQHGIRHELGINERESAKMLVILDSGEQRLITFTLPRETCTVQELLDQVGIEIEAESKIECLENPGSEIDYIVKIGNFGARDIKEMTKAAELHVRKQLQKTATNPPADNDIYTGFHRVDHNKCVICQAIEKEVKHLQMP